MVYSHVCAKDRFSWLIFPAHFFISTGLWHKLVSVKVANALAKSSSVISQRTFWELRVRTGISDHWPTLHGYRFEIPSESRTSKDQEWGECRGDSR